MHFYRLTPKELYELSNEFVEKLWEGITMLEAQAALIQLKIVDFPNMTKHTREKFHKELYKKAYPKMFLEKKTINSMEDLKGLING